MSIQYHETTNQLTRKVGFEGNTKIGPVLEVTTSYLEQRQFSPVGQNFSWPEQIGHRLDRQGVRRQRAGDLNNEDGSICVCKPIKSKSKPRRPSTTCSSSRTIPILKRTWIDIEPRAQFGQAYPVAKRLNTLLRHGELPREEDGAIEFWRLKDDLRNKFEYSQYWSDDVW